MQAESGLEHPFPKVTALNSPSQQSSRREDHESTIEHNCARAIGALAVQVARLDASQRAVDNHCYSSELRVRIAGGLVALTPGRSGVRAPLRPPVGRGPSLHARQSCASAA